MPAVIDSGSTPTHAGVERLRCAASHSAAASSGGLRAMAMLTFLTCAFFISSFAWVR
jgi:hypothetical protein